MKHALILTFILLGLPALAANPVGQLVWRSGQVLPGQVTSASEQSVSFLPDMGDLFTEPAEVSLDALEGLRFSHPASGREEAFQIRLRDGTLLHGDLVAINEGVMHLKSDLLGTFTLREEQVAQWLRIRGEGVVFVAPGPHVKWSESIKPPNNQNQLRQIQIQGGGNVIINNGVVVGRGAVSAKPDPHELKLWQTTANGGLRTNTWSNTLSSNFDAAQLENLPRALRLELRIGADDMPQFVFKFNTPDAMLRIETWEDRIVLRQGSRFAVAPKPMAKEAADLVFTLLWNRDTGAAELWEEGAGTKVAELKAAEDRKNLAEVPVQVNNPFGNNPQQQSQPGVSLENLGRNLTLNALFVTKWLADKRDAVPMGKAHVRLLDGEVLLGTLVEADPATVRVRLPSGDTSRPIQHNELMLVDAAVKVSPSGEIHKDGVTVVLRSSQGESVRGKFLGMQKQGDSVALRFQSPGSGDEWLANLGGLKDILFLRHPDARAAEVSSGDTFADRLTQGSVTVKGRAIPAGDTVPHWLLEGAIKPVPLNPATRASLQRAATPVVVTSPASGSGGVPASGDEFNALLQLRRGDLVPVKLGGMTSEAVKFTAAHTKVDHLAHQDLTAILMSHKPMITDGFNDSGWVQTGAEGSGIEGEKKDAALLKPGSALAHPLMMSNQEIKFTLEGIDASGAQGSSLRLSLFTRSTESEERGLRLLVAPIGSAIYVGEEINNGQMRRQSQTNIKGTKADISVRLQGGQVKVKVNGSDMFTMPVPAAQRLGSGLVMEPASMWGRPVGEVRISGFNAVTGPERVNVPSVDEETRRQVLTVPRFRKDDPPGHLLIAPNGDLLRGALQSLDDSRIQMRSGLETVEVPTDRVSAVVMLRDAVIFEEGDAETAAPTHWVSLYDGGRYGLTLTKWDKSGVQGIHPLLGEVAFSAESVRQIWSNEEPPTSDAMRAVSDWILIPAEAPKIPGQNGGSAGLIGEDAPIFVLSGTSDTPFSLEEQRGKVVVLDFWATWCAPCLRAIPELIESVDGLNSDQVVLMGVNQGEPSDQVKTFIGARDWTFDTVFDSDKSLGAKYGVKGIPHTVVIGPDGKVAMVHTGYTTTGAAEVAEKIRELLKLPEPVEVGNDGAFGGGIIVRPLR